MPTPWCFQVPVWVFVQLVDLNSVQGGYSASWPGGPSRWACNQWLKSVTFGSFPRKCSNCWLMSSEWSLFLIGILVFVSDSTEQQKGRGAKKNRKKKKTHPHIREIHLAQAAQSLCGGYYKARLPFLATVALLWHRLHVLRSEWSINVPHFACCRPLLVLRGMANSNSLALSLTLRRFGTTTALHHLAA